MSEGDHRIYHVTTPDVWTAAAARGAYRVSTRGRTLAEVGFIHCSYRHQVSRVADLLYPDAEELLLLVVEPSRLGAPLRVENLEGGDELFPHIYGPLELAAVVQTARMRRAEDGSFRLPPGV